MEWHSFGKTKRKQTRQGLVIISQSNVVLLSPFTSTVRVFLLSSTTRLTLYYTLIYPYIVYCNCTWSSTYISNLNRIYYLQKRAVWAITNSDYQAHSAPLFSKLGILDIFHINTFEIAKFMFYYRNNLLPLLLLNLFVMNSQIHNYGTRTAST